MAQPDQFKILKTIHLAIAGSLAFFAVVMLGLLQTGLLKVLDPSVDRIFQTVSVSISVIVVLLGFNMFKKKLMLAHQSSGTAEEKMGIYRAACLTWWAMVEGPGLLAVIGFFFTGNFAFIALAFFHVLILLLFMPRKSNIIVLLKLTPEEAERLEGK